MYSNAVLTSLDIFYSFEQCTCQYINKFSDKNVIYFSIKLELFTAKDLMSKPVITINDKAQVRKLASLLLCSSHGGFPVVHEVEPGHKVFFGIITRYSINNKSDIF